MKIKAIALATVLAAFGAFAAGTPTGLEGEYIDTEMAGSTLSVTADHWRIKVGDMDMDNTYSAKKTGDNTYAVTVTPVDAALKQFVSTIAVRKEGDILFVKNSDTSPESKYKKK